MCAPLVSVENYHEMIRVGIFAEDECVELLEGFLVEKERKSPRHSVVTGLTRQALGPILPAGWYADSHCPITLETSEPEPDFMVARGEPSEYDDHHPGGGDAALVVEVSDTNLQCDRMAKGRIYSRAHIPCYWIVNLIDKRVEVYTDPTGPADQPSYRHRHDFAPGEAVPFVLDGREVGRIPVRDILPS